ncbi:MAG: cell division protein FtsL [Arsenophonus sp.]|nr:MAG: cell division protein FtsL [Arsenophonus sp.]
MKNHKYNLITIIGIDIIQNNIIHIFLIILIIIFSFLNINLRHKIRFLTTYKELLLNKQEQLDAEWRNLLLEENSLKEYSKIEKTSIEVLKMIYIDPNSTNKIINQ